MSTPPRIFCIPARAAPIVAVLRRGPSRWFHVGRWDLANRVYESGAWFRGRLFPQKCDVSPDGRWFAYSAHMPNAQWRAGTIYEAISRLPWLHALAAWEAGSTYTRGVHFADEPGESDLGPPDMGNASPCLEKFALRVNGPAQFAVERRHGWSEADSSQPRDPKDAWDERRTVRMKKRRPNGSASLQVEGSYAAFRDIPHLREPPLYSLTERNEMELLEAVQWADWDGQGRLLVATTDGCLQVREGEVGQMTVTWEYDLSAEAPMPSPPPEWAHKW
jgi:hypothetical protein